MNANKQARLDRLAGEIDAIWKLADDADRALSKSEREEVERLLGQVKRVKAEAAVDDDVAALLGGQAVRPSDPNAAYGPGWEQLATKLQRGEKRMELPLESIIRSKALTSTADAGDFPAIQAALAAAGSTSARHRSTWTQAAMSSRRT